ncbi:hypothetical protein NM208_g311 [Fusarium decemcellulare]|uniref:Uncharacterized protein n=1 Tax=Fusarium decemcellulare TaxID=57161 RepID=A0ACC1T024_9HYPO|nr:hypothetical protein NM208_g311 [Fusarium decemcellulare]
MILYPALFLLLCLSPFAEALAARGERQDSSGSVGKPTLYQSPRFRWWWPGGWIEPNEVTGEIKSIIDGGFGGGEIGDVRDSLTEPSDPKIYGWAQQRWNQGILAAYEQANKMGGYVDMTLSPHWPTGFPGYTPDSKETMKELVHGKVFVSSGTTFQGALPLPVAAPSGNMTGNIVKATPKLVAVLAAKTNTTSTAASVVGFDPASVSVVTSKVSRDSIKWTAPTDGNYVLVAVYSRGTGQIQNMYDMNKTGPKLTDPWPAYIVDHFSYAGFEAGAKYWDEHILTNKLRSALAENGGSIFEDSLELKFKQYWTLQFAKEFKARRGYDLTPFLLYLLKDNTTYSGDAIIAEQVTNDFYQTVTDLYVDYRLKPLQQWCNKLGLKLRLQPYTASFDSAAIASQVDIPEGESLGFDGAPDSFRVLATGRDLGGKTTILSDELGAYFGKAYGVTWKFLLSTANHDMSLGVSQIVIHGFPYATSQTSLWPGYAPFTPLGGSSNGFADAWGPRQPQWMHAKMASAYLANSQKLLQESGPSIDIAILNTAWGVTATWEDKSLNDAGFSYQFPTPKLLQLQDVKVRSGNLSSKDVAYKAMVVKTEAMDVETAELILTYARAGLPIVIVGSLPSYTFSYSNNPKQDKEYLSSIMSQLAKLKTVRTVENTASVPSTLKQLGITPSVEYISGQNQTLTTLRRTKDSGYLYWIYNGGDDNFKGLVKLEGEAQPYQINLFSGKVIPLASFTTSNGYTTVEATVTSNGVEAIYLGPENPFGATPVSKPLFSTTCGSYVRDGAVYVASNTTCTATTADKKTVTLSIPTGLPSATSPSTWQLSIEDWGPADVNETGLDSSDTIKTNLKPVKLTKLAPWSETKGIENASGIGKYITRVSLSKHVKGSRVLMDVGNVDGSWSLKINGKAVSDIDWFGKPIDVTEYVENGDNDIEITVATTLWNKLRTTWPDIYGSLDAQSIGLLGPVTLNYVIEKVVA